MKKLVILFALILPLLTGGCSNEDDNRDNGDNGNQNPKTLNGTVWEYHQKGIAPDESTHTITFSESTAKVLLVRRIDKNKDGIIQEDEIGETEYNGTYKYNDPTVTLEIENDTSIYTVSGNKMTLIPTEGDSSVVYIKK